MVYNWQLYRYDIDMTTSYCYSKGCFEVFHSDALRFIWHICWYIYDFILNDISILCDNFINFIALIPNILIIWMMCLLFSSLNISILSRTPPFFFFKAHLCHVEVPGLGVYSCQRKPQPQQHKIWTISANTQQLEAMPDPSPPKQGQGLNPHPQRQNLRFSTPRAARGTPITPYFFLSSIGFWFLKMIYNTLHIFHIYLVTFEKLIPHRLVKNMTDYRILFF